MQEGPSRCSVGTSASGEIQKTLRGPEGPELNRTALGFSKTRVVPLWHLQHFKKAAKAKQQQNWPSDSEPAGGLRERPGFFRVYVIIITVTLTLSFPFTLP